MEADMMEGRLQAFQPCRRMKGGEMVNFLLADKDERPRREVRN